MVSNATLKKLFSRFWDLYRKYEKMDLFAIPFCVSSGNRKIGKVLNVSLMSVRSCGNCKGCAAYCYDVKACTGKNGKTVLDARVRNQIIFERDRSLYFWHIENAIGGRRKNFYFRWHVAGEIADLDYFSEMVRIARKYPRFMFWTYTKRYDIVNAYVKGHGGNRKKAISENLSIMFSSGFNIVNNPYDFPLFHCVLKGETVPAGFYHCPGNCDLCKAENVGKNRGCIVGENSWIDEH